MLIYLYLPVRPCGQVSKSQIFISCNVRPNVSYRPVAAYIYENRQKKTPKLSKFTYQIYEVLMQLVSCCPYLISMGGPHLKRKKLKEILIDD